MEATNTDDQFIDVEESNVIEEPVITGDDDTVQNIGTILVLYFPFRKLEIYQNVFNLPS